MSIHVVSKSISCIQGTAISSLQNVIQCNPAHEKEIPTEHTLYVCRVLIAAGIPLKKLDNPDGTRSELRLLLETLGSN